MKKLLALLLALALAAGCCLPALAAQTPLNYLLLGDSIAQGYGIVNRSEACYGRIVADTNGYNYINDAWVATDSSELLEDISDSDSYIQTEIARADIISISIGANDYFDHEDVYNLAIGAFLMLNGRRLDAIADQFYLNLCAIIDTIRTLNPDVTILLQNVYDSVWYGIGTHVYKACINRVNDKIYQYNEEHPGAVEICDICPAMNGRPECLADDCVHPNAAGNVAIAEVVLRQLYDLGLGSQTTPVVNTPGIDYNYFEKYYENQTIARFLTILVKLVTGNLR